MTENTSVVILATATIQTEVAAGANIAPEDKLLGQFIQQNFEIFFCGLSQPFAIEDQSYVLDDSLFRVQINPIELLPRELDITFEYSITVIDSDLPSGFIVLREGSLAIEVKSIDQTLAGSYVVKVDASSKDERWLDQTISTSFRLLVRTSSEILAA